MKKYFILFTTIALLVLAGISTTSAAEVVYSLSADETGTALPQGVTIVSADGSRVIQFDGGGYIKVGNQSNLNFGVSEPFSIAVIFKWNGKDGVNNLVRKSDYPVRGDGAGYWFRIGNNKLEFFVGETVGTGAPRGSVSATISPNVWYNALGVRDSEGKISLYINGELKGSASAIGANTTSLAPFTIGAWDDRFGVTEIFAGQIKEVTIYKGSRKNIKFPIKELGNCGSEVECRAYCDDDKNVLTCIEYSINNDLLSGEEKEEAKKVLEFLKKGENLPGGCATREECVSYCSEESNGDECVEFTLKAGLVQPDEVEEYKKVRQYIASGETPGGCKTKNACDRYCSDTANIEECFAFAEKAGLIPSGEIEQARKAIEFMKRGEMPGGCRNKEECMTYCEVESHMAECIEFGVKAGFMTEEEAKLAKRFLESGGPGGCKGREECDHFCNDPKNQSACFDFAVEAGFIAEEDAEFFKKQMEQGGGESRQTGGFEQMPAKVRECLDNRLGSGIAAKFASGEIAPTREMMSSMRICIEEFQNSCPAFAGMMDDNRGEGDMGQGAEQFNECLIDIYGSDVPEKMKSGDFCPPADFQQKISECMQTKFGNMGGSSGDGGSGGGFQGGGDPGFQGGSQSNYQGGGDFSGPGGCKTEAECRAYCESNPQACMGFGGPNSSGGQSNYDHGADECSNQGGYWQNNQCVFPQQQQEQNQQQNQQQYQGPDCSSFEQVPQCSYITDPQGYEYCKRCYPDK